GRRRGRVFQGGGWLGTSPLAQFHPGRRHARLFGVDARAGDDVALTPSRRKLLTDHHFRRGNFVVPTALSGRLSPLLLRRPNRVNRCWICSVVGPMDYALAERPKMQGLRMAGAFTFGIEEEYFLV